MIRSLLRKAGLVSRGELSATQDKLRQVREKLERTQQQVKDATALTLCMENKMPIVVFDLNKPDNIMKAVTGQRVGTLIEEPAEFGHSPYLESPVYLAARLLAFARSCDGSRALAAPITAQPSPATETP